MLLLNLLDSFLRLFSDSNELAIAWAGFGVIPKPTVQSGWEKMEVLQTFKMQVL